MESMSIVFHVGWRVEKSIKSETLALAGRIVQGDMTF